MPLAVPALRQSKHSIALGIRREREEIIPRVFCRVHPRDGPLPALCFTFVTLFPFFVAYSTHQLNKQHAHTSCNDMRCKRKSLLDLVFRINFTQSSGN